MSLETRKRIKTRVDLFFTSLEMKERVEVRVDLFFMSIEIRKRVGSDGSPFQSSMFLTILEIENELASYSLVQALITFFLLSII